MTDLFLIPVHFPLVHSFNSPSTVVVVSTGFNLIANGKIYCKKFNSGRKNILNRQRFVLNFLLILIYFFPTMSLCFPSFVVRICAYSCHKFLLTPLTFLDPQPFVSQQHLTHDNWIFFLLSPNYLPLLTCSGCDSLLYHSI